MTVSNGTLWLFGSVSPSSMRPGVVSKRFMYCLPSSSVCGTRLTILVCRVTAPAFSAWWTSDMSEIIVPSPGSPSRSIDR